MIFKEDKDLLIECEDTCSIFRIDCFTDLHIDYPFGFRYYSDEPSHNTKLINKFNNEVWNIDKEVLCYFAQQFDIKVYTEDTPSCFLKPFKKKYYYIFRVEPIKIESDYPEAYNYKLYQLNCDKVKLPNFIVLNRDTELNAKKKHIFDMMLSRKDIDKIQKYLIERYEEE